MSVAPLEPERVNGGLEPRIDAEQGLLGAPLLGAPMPAIVTADHFFAKD